MEEAGDEGVLRRLHIPNLTYYAPKEVIVTPEQCPPYAARRALDPHGIFLNNFTAACASPAAAARVGDERLSRWPHGAARRGA